jgi:hypothetical protein
MHLPYLWGTGALAGHFSARLTFPHLKIKRGAGYYSSTAFITLQTRSRRTAYNPLNHNSISRAADSGESEPCTRFSVMLNA